MPFDTNTTTSSTQVATLLRKAPVYFAALLVVTALLLAWHHFGMQHVVEMSPRSGHLYTVSSDATDGGGSNVKLRQVGDALQMDCELVKKFQWPYCKLRFEISAVGKGLDLSEFEFVSIDVDYAGTGAPKAKMFLQNFDREWSRVDTWISQKINEVEAFDIPADRPARLPLHIFYAAGWWKSQAKPPLDRSGMQIDNVVGVELVTEGEAPPGRHLLTVRAIRFHGKLITQNTLLAALISVWIASAMGWAGLLSFTLRRELNTSKAQLKLLSEVNRALKLETEQLAGQAYHDPLTGALNREGLRAELMSTSRLMTDPVSVVFLDIDHFKRINDNHGHETGDEVLRQFVAIVSAKIRSSDRLVRWGGEEFLLLCPMSDVHQAAALAEKLRLALMEAQWPAGIAVTSSFGVAQHNLHEEISQVIKRADDQLYRAKHSGRNRVHADFGRHVGGAAASAPGAMPTEQV